MSMEVRDFVPQCMCTFSSLLVYAVLSLKPLPSRPRQTRPNIWAPWNAFEICRTSGLWHSRPTQQEATDQQKGVSIGRYTYTLVDDALEPPCRVICTPVNFSHIRPQLSARSNCTFSKQFLLASQGRTTNSRLLAAYYERRRMKGNIDVYHRP